MTDEFEVKNRRRIQLIEKKYSGGLGEQEAAELLTLSREVSEYVRMIAVRSTDVFDHVSARIEKIKEKRREFT